jgi:hypothetical protein
MQPRCRTIVTVESDNLLVIEDTKIQDHPEFTNGHHILTALKKIAREEKIEFKLKEPINNFSTPMRIKFSLTANIDTALHIIRVRFPLNTIDDKRVNIAIEPETKTLRC